MNIIEKYQKDGLVPFTELKDLKIEMLRQLKEIVEEDLAQLNTQIVNALAEVKSSGRYSDPWWFANTRLEKSRKGRLYNNILQELSKRKKETKAVLHAEHRLIKAMRATLPEKIVDQILEFAERMP